LEDLGLEIDTNTPKIGDSRYPFGDYNSNPVYLKTFSR
jgi:hypothetical protein